jgi:ABC-type transport system involved in multi-copper enzyme maturation permease subunit
MMIAFVLSIVGFLYVLVLLVYIMLCKDVGTSPAALLGCFHLLSFLAGIIGFPIGISFALELNNSSVGVAAILAIVAVIMNLVSVILLCVGLVNSDDETPAAGQNSHEQAQMEGDRPANLSARYSSAADDAAVF